MSTADGVEQQESQLRVAVAVEQLWHRVPGGTARATKHVLEAFASIDEVETHGIAAWHRPQSRQQAEGCGSITYIPTPRPALYESWLRLGRPSVERFVGPVDVVWALSMIPMPTQAPVVATVHDLGFLHHPERLSKRGQTFFPRIWAAIRDSADLIVCPSQIVANDCLVNGVPDRRLRVVHWGVMPPESSADDAEAVRAELGLPERFALWVGTLEPRKNLPRLVAAMAKVPDLDLVLVGPTGWNVDGDDVLKPLGERAHRIGVVDDATLSALYRAASVFVFPSLLEGFGLPVLEALSHGTPVVTSTGTATEEVAGRAARLVNPLDPDAIAAAVSAVFDEPDLTAKLVALGRQRATELSWMATAEGYASVFREAAGV